MASEALKIAHEARSAVREVDLNQKGHDKLCALRYKAIEAWLETHSADIKGLYARFWAAAIGVIIVLISIAGFQYQQAETHKESFEKMVTEAISKK